MSPPPDDVYPNKDTTKVLDNAAKIMKDRKDSYLAVDALILAVLPASDVSSALQEAGIPRAQLEDAVKEVSMCALQIRPDALCRAANIWLSRTGEG